MCTFDANLIETVSEHKQKRIRSTCLLEFNPSGMTSQFPNQLSIISVEIVFHRGFTSVVAVKLHSRFSNDVLTTMEKSNSLYPAHAGITKERKENALTSREKFIEITFPK